MKNIKQLLLVFGFIFSVTELTKAQIMPTDFTFNYSFGFGLKKTVDHRTNYDGTNNMLTVYGVDTVMRISLSLTPNEKQKIYDELQKINFTSYREKYLYQQPDSVEAFVGIPCSHFLLAVIADSKVKSVDWNDCLKVATRDLKHEALMQLDRLIQKIIWAYKPLKDYHPTRMKIDPE